MPRSGSCSSSGCARARPPLPDLDPGQLVGWLASSIVVALAAYGGSVGRPPGLFDDLGRAVVKLCVSLAPNLLRGQHRGALQRYVRLAGSWRSARCLHAGRRPRIARAWHVARAPGARPIPARPARLSHRPVGSIALPCPARTTPRCPSGSHFPVLIDPNRYLGGMLMPAAAIVAAHLIGPRARCSRAMRSPPLSGSRWRWGWPVFSSLASCCGWTRRRRWRPGRHFVTAQGFLTRHPRWIPLTRLAIRPGDADAPRSARSPAA